MKRLLPVVLVIVGLGAGIGVGTALKPAPEPEAGAEAAEAAACPEGEHCGAKEPALHPVASRSHPKPDEVEFVALEKPFVVPVFEDERIVAMVVLSLSVEVAAGHAKVVSAVEPRLRDQFLAVMFRHANSGGFAGSFTTGQKMQDLKSALNAAARQVMPDEPAGDVLITEIVRQDV
jgi:flagellar protein FliL